MTPKKQDEGARLSHGPLASAVPRPSLAAMVREQSEMFRQLAAHNPAALWIRDVERRTIEYANPAWERLTGYAVVPGASIDEAYRAIHPDDLNWLTHERRHASGDAASTEYRLVHPDGTIRWVHARAQPIANPSSNTPWIAEFMEDITQRREAQGQLLRLARHDALTDLPNRTTFYEALQSAIAHAADEGSTVAVLLLDIDEFKSVNDTLGHAAGDTLLREFAIRIAGCVRPGDVVGRLGGDEFAVIVPTPTDSHGADEVAERICRALQTPLSLESRDVIMTTSIGIASCPADATELETLIRYADAAMYEAKAAGRNNYRCYSAEMMSRAMRKSDIAGALRFAQVRDEFVLHYQPQMHIDSGAWTGIEALLRWNRPDNGLIMAGQFVSTLEEMGLIVPVGTWVVDMACRQLRDLQRCGLGRIRVAVNVSSKQIRDARFVSTVADLIAEHHVVPTLLEFEITEGALNAHGEAAELTMRKLKDLGISITIDDFGTGFSNLAHLSRLPVDALKIDNRFIRDLATSKGDATVAIAIINLAHSLGLKVVAEGVETPEQLGFLRDHGCDEIQGYLLSKPLPAEQLPAQLRFITGTRGLPWLVAGDSRWSAANA